jgi:hypothetical protein
MKLSTFNFQLSTNRGQATVIASLFFLLISTTITLGIVHPVTSHMAVTRSLEEGSRSFYAAEGAREDVTYRLIKGMPVDVTETLDLGTATATAITTTVFNGKEVSAMGNRDNFLRQSKVHLVSGSGAAFNYGLQAGAGGISLTNEALVAGNVYSNGPVTGSNDNLVQGTVVSAGPSGLINGVHATSSAYAHTIQNADIDGNAYYQAISGSSVAGTLHPGSPDLATTTLPISDALIGEWEAAAEAGGTQSTGCSYTGAVTLGPKKFNCNLSISGSANVTLAGPIWVVGDLTVSNSADVRISSSLSGKSVPIIADKASAPTTSGKITLSNSSEYFGSGANSYIVMVSQNKSAEQGGGTSAITISNGAKGDLILYAGHGLVTISNDTLMKAVTGYKVGVHNEAAVRYDSGLANLVFSSGPAGGYTIDSWNEVE